MQLKLSTDYAIRIVLYLAVKRKKVLLEELSQNLMIDKSYVFKFCKKLYYCGIVGMDDDVHDEIYLMKHPSEITMFDIINVMESTTKINLCLEEDEYCSQFATKYCPVRKYYFELQNNIESYLKSKTIYDLLNS